MEDCGGGTHGPFQSADAPTPPTTPQTELRRITRSLTSSRKRRRAVVDTAFTGQDELPGRGFIGSGTNSQVSLGDLLELVSSLKTLINDQSKTIEEQGSTIALLRNEIIGVKDQNAHLSESIESLHVKLSTAQTTAPQRTWATVAARPNTNAINGEATSTARVQRESNRENACVRISTAPQAIAETDHDEDHTFRRFLSSEKASEQIREALNHEEATQEVQVAGIGPTKTGYIVRFRDEDSAKVARENTQWLTKLGNNTKLVKQRFGVVVHRTPTAQVNFDDKEQAIGKLTEENELAARKYRIEDIAWLRNREKPLGRSASLGIWYDTKEAAEWTINNGLVFGNTYVGSVEAFQHRKKRCHRCQGTDHFVRECKEPSRCGHCAGNHERRECLPDTQAKCIDCGGGHPTGHRQCGGTATNSRTQ
jgi:hypothetical protein